MRTILELRNIPEKSIASPGLAALLFQHDLSKTPLLLPPSTCQKGDFICSLSQHAKQEFNGLVTSEQTIGNNSSVYLER